MRKHLKLLKSELERVKGKELESFLTQTKYRLSVTPFGAGPGKVIAYVSRSVPWKKKGRVPKKLSSV